MNPVVAFPHLPYNLHFDNGIYIADSKHKLFLVPGIQVQRKTFSNII
jgi:hypothetical protein